jgi:anaerobic selenocysteine-containing dehydrogenase
MSKPVVERIAHRICPLCEACCGLEFKIAGERVVGIRGHAQDVLSAGYICPKGASLKDLHEDPDRLRTPLIKRDGRFVEATWEGAFLEIERRLPPVMQAYGNDAVAMTIGNPTSHKFGLIRYLPRLRKALGTRNVFSASTLDQMPKHLSVGLMFGDWLSFSVPDIARCDFLLIIGANPIVSNGSLWTVPDYRGKAKAMRARGGQIVTVDPRRTETAAAADEHHFIRPGSDVYFLLGLIHTVFDENLVRLGRLSPHVNGVEELRTHVAAYAPEHVAERCGIAAPAIRALARRLAGTERAAVYGRIGTCTQEFGTTASWLIDALNVLTGHLDQEGGAMFSKAPAFAANAAGKSGVGKGVATGRYRSRVSGAPEVMGEFPIGCLAEEIGTPGKDQVKALISIASNPVLSAPNGARLSQALEQLDFMVSIDIYLNETSRHADVILPGLSPLEELHYDAPFPQFAWRNYARYSEPVLSHDPQHPPEWQTLLRLAAIAQGKGSAVDVGQLDDDMFAEDVARAAGDQAPAILSALSHLSGPERQIDFALRMGPYGDRFGQRPDGITLEKIKAAPGGIDLGPLQPRIPELLRTPSGKIELAPAPLLADLERVARGMALPLPELVIIGRRQVRSCNSWLHNLPTLAKGPFRCTALVNPQDAARRGLSDGGTARIEAHGMSLQVLVEFSDAIMPGVVSLPHGWGHDLAGTKTLLAAERPGVNLNALFSEDDRDPLSGTAILSGVPVAMTCV